MRNTRKRLIGLITGLSIPILFAVFFLFGCEKNVTYVIEGDYETIDGEYKVKITEVEDTCYNELSEPWEDVMDVLVQEEYDDGTYLVDIVISNEIYLPDVKVEPNGKVKVGNQYADDEMNLCLDGELTPEKADLTLSLEYLNWYGEVKCYMTYEMKGSKRYVSAPPQ